MSDNKSFSILFDSVDQKKWIKQISDVCENFNDASGCIKKAILCFEESITIEKIKPFHLVTLACLIQYLVDSGLQVSISKKNISVHNYIYYELRFHEYWKGGKNHVEASVSDNVFNLWRIVETEKDLYAKQVEEYFRRKYFHEKDLSAISVSLVEAYYNIFDHADAKGNAFSIIQYDENNSVLFVAISDFGIGIAQSVKNFDKDIKTDSDAILKALEDSFTVKSTKRNRGFGFSNILSPTDNALLISHHGWVFKEGDNVWGKEHGFLYPGTLICYEVNLSKMEKEEIIQEFNFEL